MTHEIAIAGWVAAAVALVATAAVRRTLSVRMQAVARACHELRGPLGAVQLGLELGARPGQLSPERLRAIELELGRAALALDELAQAPRGRRHDRWARELVDIEELLADSVEAWRAAAVRRGVEVWLRRDGPRAIVVGDRLRLAQATGNLLANAIDHGGRTIVVRGRVEGGAVRIEVDDDGPGLSRPLAELMRSARRRRGRLSAHGHGLAIVSAIAEAHGGRLASAPSERGARLVLELPLAEGLSLKEA
jgi:signal transduction histidine kinase